MDFSEVEKIIIPESKYETGLLEYKGNTEQQTYTGKNLFDKNDYDVLGGYFSSSDTVITASSSARNRVFWIQCQPSTTYSFLLPASSYGIITKIGTTTTEPAGGVAVTGSVRATDASYNGYTTSNDANYLCLYMQAPSGVNFGSIVEEVVQYIQIEQGSTATSYEPYVGGMAAPNPDYPQPIHTVTGKQTVKVVGKNLFADTSDGFTKPVDYYVRPIQLKQGKTYQFYAQLKSGETAISRIVVGIVPYGENYSEFSSVMENIINFNASTVDKVIVPDATWTSPKIAIYASDAAQIDEIMDTYDIMLEESPTKTAYEPYQEQSYEVTLVGKNLFDGLWELGSIDLTGANVNDDKAIRSIGYTAVEPSTTYTISTENNCSIFPVYYDQDRNYLSYNATQYTPKTITTPDNCHYIRLRTRQSENITNVNLKCQLEYGATATSYAPYFPPIELCKIGDYQDYIYKSGGAWYIYKEITKYSFTGAEQWTTSEYGTNTWTLSGFQFPFDTTKKQIISNIFKGVSHDDRATGGDNIIYTGTANTFYIRNTTLDTLASVQSATSGNYIYYALATPTTTEITNTGLLAQLNALGSYDAEPTITISAVSPNLPAILKPSSDIINDVVKIESSGVVLWQK